MREPFPTPSKYEEWTGRVEKRWLASVAQRIVCNSEAVAGSFPVSTKVAVVRNGIDLSRYDPARGGRSFRRQYGIPDDVSLVGTVGRLRPWKRHDRFIRVASRIAAQDPEARFVVAGGNPLESAGSCRDDLETLAAELDLGPRLLFTGHLGDVRPALAAFDVFVHSGEPEPFGLVNIEAMAMALPVVAFSHGALPEIVDHQGTGCLVSPGDLDEMTAAVLELLRHPEQRRLWGQRGRAKVERHFTIARVAAEMTEIYESLVPAPSP